MTSARQLDRYAERVTLGGKVVLGGLVIGSAGAAWLLPSAGFPLNRGTFRATPGGASLLVLGGLLIVLGCAAYVIQPALDERTRSQVPFATVRTSLAMFIFAAAVANILSLPVTLSLQRGVGVGGPGQRQLGALALTYLIAASEFPVLGVLWLRLVRPRLMRWRELGMKLGALAQQIGLGLVGGVLLFATAGIVSLVLTRVGVHQNQFERFEGIEGAPIGLFLLALLSGSVLAPLAEELFFRGYVFQTFLQRHGPPAAYLFSAALFAVVHANLAAAVPIFAMGLILAAIFQRSGSVVPGVIAHGLNNAISFCLLYAGVKG